MRYAKFPITTPIIYLLVQELTWPPISLGKQLQEIIDLVTTTPRFQADLQLLSGAIDDFYDSLEELGGAISSSLAAAALEIAKIAYPEGISQTLLFRYRMKSAIGSTN